MRSSQRLTQMFIVLMVAIISMGACSALSFNGGTSTSSSSSGGGNGNMVEEPDIAFLSSDLTSPGDIIQFGYSRDSMERYAGKLTLENVSPVDDINGGTILNMDGFKSSNEDDNVLGWDLVRVDFQAKITEENLGKERWARLQNEQDLWKSNQYTNLYESARILQDMVRYGSNLVGTPAGEQMPYLMGNINVTRADVVYHVPVVGLISHTSDENGYIATLDPDDMTIKDAREVLGMPKDQPLPATSDIQWEWKSVKVPVE